jgi:hypothetical protein
MAGMRTGRRRSEAALRRPAGRHGRPQRHGAPIEEAVLGLQRHAGNRAVTGLLRGQGRAPDLGRLGIHIQRETGDGAVADFVRARPPVVAEDAPAEREARRAESRTGGLDRTATPGAVRLHTGSAAAALADSMNAEAVTWNRNIFFGTGRHAPGTPEGDRLLRHELTHATRHTPGVAHRKPVSQTLDFLRIMKIPIGVHKAIFAGILENATESWAKAYGKKIKPPQGQGDGGHWWIELGTTGNTGTWTPVESYGWWPTVDRGGAKPMYSWEVLKLKRVDGAINQDGSSHDKHEGDPAPTWYYPRATFDDELPYAAVRAHYEGLVRNFARSFSGSWNWRLNWGKNCHTFIERLERALGFSAGGNRPTLRDPRRSEMSLAAAGLDAGQKATLNKFATLRGYGPAELLNGILYLAQYGVIDKNTFYELNHDDDLRAAVLQSIGAQPRALNNAIRQVFPGYGNLFP